MTKKLLDQIKRERAGRKEKRSLRHSLFEVVACIVRQHRLSENFLNTIDKAVEGLDVAFAADQAQSPRVKPQLDISPFPLLQAEEYKLCRAIIEKLDCHYLQFARSPDELLLCKTLAARNALIDPEELSTRHFETLLLREIAVESLSEPESDSTPFPNSEAPL